MDSIRQNKVGRLIQRDLSEMFQKECKEFTAGAMLSVTAVRVSPDMSYARVYLSIFPSSLTEKVLESLTEKNKSIRFILGFPADYDPVLFGVCSAGNRHGGKSGMRKNFFI